MIKKVKYLIPAQEIDIDGVPIKQALPIQKLNQVDPFLLLHHASAYVRNDSAARHQEISPHRHCSFSPVTFIIEGVLQHRNRWENNQTAKQREAQWMPTGAGIIHREHPSEALCEQRGKFVSIY